MPDKTHGRQNGREGMRDVIITDPCLTCLSCMKLLALSRGIHSHAADFLVERLIHKTPDYLMYVYVNGYSPTPTLMGSTFKHALKILQPSKEEE